MFATGAEDVLSPITFPSDQLMTTPAMLGLKPNGHRGQGLDEERLTERDFTGLFDSLYLNSQCSSLTPSGCQ
ncbi:hypothetical protein ANCDUO_02423 [Ancylostoma duodenale]|uniref:Uncharacterized protein n=1 Tax=Ancylostoma duodenale TaxID=51022 RepID=A0A0C2DBQ7_9BILA|nr:hypothetical protein ANCDUO_02423 [Ancylostoma duodenale]